MESASTTSKSTSVTSTEPSSLEPSTESTSSLFQAGSQDERHTQDQPRRPGVAYETAAKHSADAHPAETTTSISSSTHPSSEPAKDGGHGRCHSDRIHGLGSTSEPAPEFMGFPALDGPAPFDVDEDLFVMDRDPLGVLVSG